ncbi:S8 family serine peptidase [Leptolyngbya sp. CCNP1308]|uniref:S8 family serine peptidase n=1 Tax=Leptolyngbya sp. CCNP1308 TaxID=3110255 RepID=UPI002B1EED2C|nr:S8 family serine peptidase [Leptolyngbya sp. CCNP1308]MEA5451773.1 S8 family serine peptidase [Leptolyngbya sp. CCNP1308]
MPHPNLSSYKDGFFEWFLAELPGSPTLESLEQRQPANCPLVLMADYTEYSGAALTPLPNGSITPQFAIRTETEGAVRTYVMLWVVERLDVATDSRQTIARILADFRPSTALEDEAEVGLSSSEADAWASALDNAAIRQALAQNLGTLTAVPAGLPTSDLDELRSFLLHFGTYRPDGTYYAKGTVAEGEFPAGVSPDYLAPETGNFAEIKLQRDSFYCFALVPEQYWHPQASASNFRQLVYRIDDLGEAAADRWRLALLHTVASHQPDAPAFARFIFFHADVGVGLPIAATAQSSLAPSTAGFLEDLPEWMAALGEALRDPNTPIVGTEQSPYVLLLGSVAPDFPRTPLPEGVIEDGSGAIRTFRCPPEQVMALAERSDVENLELSTPVWVCMTDAKNEINLAGRTLPAGITPANTGRDIVVGIVDSGIDGGHPAFLGRQDDATKTRIHAVWNMDESGGQSPWQRSGQNAAYRSMNFGREYLGHDEVITTTDYVTKADGTHSAGHGTHVAGIAAGRAVGGWPGGIAPRATLVVAGVGSTGGYVNDVIAGVKYCFQKATELGKPCVVNISLSTQRHSHDGTDPLSIGLTQLVSQNILPATGLSATGLGSLPSAMPSYIDGRVICAAADNLRGDHVHWQATVAAGDQVEVVYQPQSPDGITFWAYNEDGTAVRLDLSTRHSTNAILATPEISLRASNGAVSTNLPGGVQVNLHNGPERPNNRHYSPEVYWSGPLPAGPWIVRFRNRGRSVCVIHGFAAYRSFRGQFILDPAVTQPLIGVTYTAAQLAQFETCKVGTPANAPGTIGVAAFTSRPGISSPVDEIAPFSSPGPLRAAAPGQRAIDVTAPGHIISSAKSWMPSDTSRGVVDMSGTSMASPIVTGLVAALLQMDANLDTGQIRDRLELASTRRPTDGVDDWGLGRIDAAQFLRV